MEAESRRVAELFQKFDSYYSLRLPRTPEGLQGFPVAGARFKVFLRELVADPIDGPDSLLKEAPGRVTLLKRRPQGRYEGQLRIVPSLGDRGDEMPRSYELLQVEYQAPGGGELRACRGLER